MEIPVEEGFSYHANIIYNEPKLRNNLHKHPDCQTSLAVTKYVVDLLDSWGYKKTYYNGRDALPGGNVFDEFFKTVKASRYTITIVTRGFVSNSWGRYKQQSAFLKLIDKNEGNKFIALFIDLDDCHIPEELNSMQRLEFGAQWRNDTNEWNRLRTLLQQQLSVQATSDGIGRSNVTTSVSRSIPTRLLYVQPTSQNRPVSGIQDTNPPSLTALRGDIFTDAPSSIETDANLNNCDTPTTDAPRNDGSSGQRGDNPESLRLPMRDRQNSAEILYQRNSSTGIGERLNSEETVNNRNSSINTGEILNSEETVNNRNSATDTGDRLNSEETFHNRNSTTSTSDRADTNNSASDDSRSLSMAPSTANSDSSFRLPPDGQDGEAAHNQILHSTLQTRPKDIDNGMDQNNEDMVLSSLNQQDVEPDNNQSSEDHVTRQLSQDLQSKHDSNSPQENRRREGALNSQNLRSNQEKRISINNQDSNIFALSNVKQSKTEPIPDGEGVPFTRNLQQLKPPDNIGIHSDLVDSGYALSLNMESINQSAACGDTTPQSINMNRPCYPPSPVTAEGNVCQPLLNGSAASGKERISLGNTLKTLIPDKRKISNVTSQMLVSLVNTFSKCDQSFM